MSKSFGRLHASVEIDIQNAFDDLSADEQKEFLSDNIGILDNDILVDELESRGYIIENGGDV